MNDTIDTLKIKVEGEGQSAERTLDRVLKKLERLKEATRGMNGQGTSSLNTRMTKLSDTVGSIKDKFKAVSQVTEDLREKTRHLQRESVVYTDAMDDVKEKAEQSQSRFKTLSENIKDAFKTSRPAAFVSVLKTIGRIAFYRMIRSMLREVTEGFKTGIDNMYQYSKTFSGKYAQSMDQLASANLTFKNSIGAILAPLIERVTPWLDSVLTKLVEINNTIAMVFAGLAGKSTYSKAVRVTTEYAEAANKAADNTSNVTEKVEELKRSLAGLDEITIIGQNLSPISGAKGGNDAVSSGLDYGSMFVETPVDMAKVNEIKKKFEDILEIAKWIGLALAAWELGKFIFGIGQAIAEIGRLKAGIALMITGFTIEAIGGYHIGYGDADVWDYIKLALGSILGVAGSVLVFGSNPIGWTIGITAAVAIAIASITVGMNARLADVVEQAFYDAGGTITISDLADQFERYCKAVVNANQPTIDLGKEIRDTIDNTINPAADSILSLGRAAALSEFNAEIYLPQIVEQINQLESGTKKVLDDVYDNIVRAVSGSLFDSLSDAGVYVPGLLETLARVKGETDKTVENAIQNIRDLTEEFNGGKISGEVFRAQMGDLTEQIQRLSGATDPAKEALDRAKTGIEGIDWQNKEARDTAFAKIGAAAQEARDSIDDAYTSIKNSVEIARTWSDDPQYQIYLDDILTAAGEDRDRQLANLRQYTEDFMGEIQDDIIAKMGGMTDTLKQEFESLDPWMQFFHGGDAEYVRKGLNDYKANTIDPIMTEIENLYATVGVEGSGFASSAAGEIINSLFAPTGTLGSSSVAAWNGKSLESAIKDTYESIGRNIPEGLAKGMKAGAYKPSSEMQDTVDTIKDTITQPARGMGIQSPSKVTAEYGKYIDLGFAKGISENQQVVVIALDNLLNQMLSRLETFGNRWRESINTMFDDMAYGWKNADFRSDGSYSYKYLMTRNIQRFAQGGFPEDGLFYANHNELVGQFSNGKTAVANNEMIVEGIAEGVAEANAEQNNLLREQNRLLREQNRLIQEGRTIDVSTIASAFNRKNQRDGKVTVPVST